MKRLFFFMTLLLLSSVAWSQVCQKQLTGPLFTRIPTIGGTGICDQGPPTPDEGNPVTFQDVYHDTVAGDDNSVSPGVVMDQYSPQLSATGRCYYKPAGDGRRAGFLEAAVIKDCPPLSENKISIATSTSDFNRFMAQMYNVVIGFDITGNRVCKKQAFVQNLVQWPGVECLQSPGGGGPGGNPCIGGEGPPDPGFSNNGGTIEPLCSPIIIDTEGDGFHLTSAAGGVMFDVRGDGHPIRIAWTAPGSHNAFLALDRDGSGTITSGKELFGNFTAQLTSNNPNGFLALAEFDKPENGGNNDGVIDEHDAVYSKLRLWIDDSHDGIAQPGELHTLPELGVFSLGLRQSVPLPRHGQSRAET